jgi:hypothetical protein
VPDETTLPSSAEIVQRMVVVPTPLFRFQL